MLPIIFRLGYFLFFPIHSHIGFCLASMVLNICYIVVLDLVIAMSMCVFRLLHILLVIHLLLFLAIHLQIVLLILLHVSLLTPFFFPATFSANIPILNPFSKSWHGFIPIFRNSSLVIASLGQKSLKYFSTSDIGNMSFPAGTGVCVVNTVCDDTMSLATSNDTCFSFITFFINSNIRNDECPSFM